MLQGDNGGGQMLLETKYGKLSLAKKWHIQSCHAGTFRIFTDEPFKVN
jgi:hypothetical protein